MSSLLSQASGFTCRLISRWLGDDSPAASSNWRREWKVNLVFTLFCVLRHRNTERYQGNGCVHVEDLVRDHSGARTHTCMHTHTCSLM